MNLKVPKLNTNIWIILSALIVLVLFYIFYLEYYVKVKESRIITTRFRVLDQMGENVDQRLGSFLNNARDLEKKVTVEWENAKADVTNKLCADTIPCLIERLNTRGDINKNLKVIRFLDDIHSGESFEDDIEDWSSKNFYFSVKVPKSPFHVNSRSGESLMIMETSYKSLIKGLDRNDVFDDLVLIRDSIVVYNTLGQEMILMPGNDNSLHLQMDSEAYNVNGNLAHSNSELHLGTLFSGEAFDLTISNQVFKAFLKPIEVNKETWYALGLMEKSKFKATSRGIEPWLIILLSLLLIFIILGMPVIKLMVMSNTEQLDTSTLVSYAMSIILGGSILVLFVFFMSQDSLKKRSVNERLEALSGEITKAFNEEVLVSYRQMEVYDSVYGSMNFDDPSNYFNNEIVSNILNKEGIYYPTLYPYGDYYFWVNDHGIQSAYLTPDVTFGKLSNLSKRDYVNKKDEWFLPGSKKDKFRVESIVSITSGTVKAAISKRSKQSGNQVIAISSRFYSIINTIIPKDYSFCIIDNSGKVWFHSNENLNMKENFISECNDNNYLQAAIYAGISKSTNVNYYNEPHRIYISPIDRLPLQLVTMYSKKSELSFQAQVITLTLALIGFLLLMLFLQLIALMIIERTFKLSLTKNVIMKLTRPIKRLNSRYLYLIKVNLVIIVLITPFMVMLQGMHAIAAIFTMTIIMFTYAYWVLNDNDFKKPHRKWFAIFNFFLLILINIITFILLNGGDNWQVLLFEATILAGIFICDKIFDKDSKKLKNDYWTNFNRLMVLVVIISGIIPTLKFYELAFNTETDIRLMHNMLDLGKQRDERNLVLDSFYDRFGKTEEITKVENKRKELGIYTKFIDMKYNSQWSLSEEYEVMVRKNYWDTVVGFLRPFYDDYINENKFLIFTKQQNNRYSWYQGADELVLSYNSLTEDSEKGEIMPYYISSHRPHLSFYAPFKGRAFNARNTILFNILFWITVLGLILIIYKLLKFGVYQIFCHDIVENYHHQDFDKILRQQVLANKDILVTRLSARDESEYFGKAFLSDSGTFTVDWAMPENVSGTPKKINTFVKQNQVDQDQSTIIFIDHFASGYEAPKLFEEKLKVVSLLTNRKDIHLVLFSQFSPSMILNHYKEAIAELKQEMIEQSKRISYKLESYQSVLHEFNRLSQILILDYLPVRYHQPEDAEQRYCNDKPRVIGNDEMIAGELHASDYLINYKKALDQYNKDYCVDKNVSNPEELIVTKINMLAENYFDDLFNSCSPQEQYVLFDLAFDQIMNPKNEKAIFSLLQKGLLVKKCYKINFMNISFRRFVMSKLDKSTKAELEKKMGNETGTWQGYRATLIMVIIGLFVFIALANQDFLDNLNQLFVALGGGIAVITGVLGLLSRKSKSSTTD